MTRITVFVQANNN